MRSPGEAAQLGGGVTQAARLVKLLAVTCKRLVGRYYPVIRITSRHRCSLGARKFQRDLVGRCTDVLETRLDRALVDLGRYSDDFQTNRR